MIIFTLNFSYRFELFGKGERPRSVKAELASHNGLEHESMGMLYGIMGVS